VDNGGLFADIGFTSSRTILASFDTLGSETRPESRPLPAPPLFLTNDNVLWTNPLRGSWLT
jgi:hypothetical protein